VAATRAKEKLLVSGHTKWKKGGSLTLAGWLGWLGAQIGLPKVRLDAVPKTLQTLPLSWPNEDLICVLHPPRPAPLSPDLAQLAAVLEAEAETATVAPAEPTAPLSPDLLEPIYISPTQDTDDKTRQQEQEPPTRVWRVVPHTRQRPPAWVLGQLTHVALAHWCFPDQPDFRAFLRAHALETGLVDEKEIDMAISQVQQLLIRFQQHPLYAELDDAERHHELPYSVELAEGSHSGIIDLLYRTDDGWAVIEFKTDELRTTDDLSAHIADQKYDQQVARYVEAVAQLLGERPTAHLVFLNVGHQVHVETWS
jgi:ATP-dependent exoDNAse (exonuclease V) beta subunit